MIVTRRITITMVENAEDEAFGIEVEVDEGLSTLEAVGLIEMGRTQYIQSKHNQGPTVFQWPDPDASPESPA